MRIAAAAYSGLFGFVLVAILKRLNRKRNPKREMACIQTTDNVMDMKARETMHPIQTSPAWLNGLTVLAPWATATGAEPATAPAPWLMGVGLLVGIGLLYVAYRMGQHRHARAQRELLTAGQWALNRASEVSDGDPALHLAVRDRLERWLAQLQRPATKVVQSQLSEDIRADLELARDFQLAYLNRPYPQIPETHFEGRLRLEFDHLYQPATALGGDFFDIMPLATDTAGVFVADVMGHGARSALITAMLRTVLRDLKSQGRNARHYITEVNKAMCEMMRSFPQPLFASAFYFVPDTTSRIATFTTAGHPAPYHIHRSMGRLTRLSVPAPHGAALGIMPKEEYTGGHVRLIDNDAFIFFTDGTYEAANGSGEEFGLARMEETIRKCLYKDIRTIVKTLNQTIRQFAGDTPLSDDICIVAVGVTSKPEDPTDS